MEYILSKKYDTPELQALNVAAAGALAFWQLRAR